LHHAVGWSYDLLDDDEQTVLQRCSVFAGGFDVAAATAICERSDEYTALDDLDSLVRKSLITVEQVDRHARYGMLETIRQFAADPAYGPAAVSLQADPATTHSTRDGPGAWPPLLTSSTGAMRSGTPRRAPT